MTAGDSGTTSLGGKLRDTAVGLALVLASLGVSFILLGRPASTVEAWWLALLSWLARSGLSQVQLGVAAGGLFMAWMAAGFVTMAVLQRPVHGRGIKFLVYLPVMCLLVGSIPTDDQVGGILPPTAVAIYSASKNWIFVLGIVGIVGWELAERWCSRRRGVAPTSAST